MLMNNNIKVRRHRWRLTPKARRVYETVGYILGSATMVASFMTIYATIWSIGH